MSFPTCVSIARVSALGAALLVFAACGDVDPDRPQVEPTRTGPPSVTATLPSPTGSLSRPTRSPTESATTPPASSPAPTRTSTPTPTPSPPASSPDTPTATVTASVTETTTVTPTATPTATPTDTPTPTPDATETPTVTTPVPSPTETPTAEEASTDESATIPSWVWWLLGLVALTAAIVIPLVVRSRRRRAWASDLAGATDEVVWFARVLLPQLRASAEPSLIAAGWGANATRVASAEDRLTAMVATAPNDVEQARALGLRDSVRAAREQLGQLAAPANRHLLPDALPSIAARLDAGLAAVDD